MAQSRVQRGTARRRARRRTTLLVVLGVLALLGVAALVAYTQFTKKPERVLASAEQPLPYTESGEASTVESEPVSQVASETVDGVALVEVPNVVGRAGGEAMGLLTAAGLRISTPIDNAVKVTGQDPEAGSVVASGTIISLSVSAVPPAQAKSTDPTPVVVCIDPGHQAHSDTKKEPVGPGSSETKARVAGGATGVTTRIPEYEIALQISTNLKRRLEAAGVKVVMTRTTNDVSISNAERAQIANAAKADLFVRIHGNGSPESSAAGISTLYPGSTPWTKPISERSRQAADIIQRSTLTATGAPNDGVTARTDLAGFNWATVPSVLVECGYLSNPVEDKLLSSPQYQDKVAMGIAAGVLRYLGR